MPHDVAVFRLIRASTVLQFTCTLYISFKRRYNPAVIYSYTRFHFLLDKKKNKKKKQRKKSDPYDQKNAENQIQYSARLLKIT